VNKFTVLPVSLDESVFEVKLLFTFYGALDFMKKANLMIAGSLGFLVLGLGLVGCGNPKDASKGNFAKAISQKLEKEPHTIPGRSNGMSRGDCAISVGAMGTERYYADKGNDELVRLGFLSRKAVTIPPVSKYSSAEERIVYELTDQGKKIAQLSSRGSNNQYNLPFCKVSFKEVISYTEPSDAMGVKASHVKYAYTLGDFPDWVKDEALLNLSDSMKSAVDSAGKTLTAEQSLVLTNEGWSTDLPG
jgi:hypothetical protein